MIKNPARTLIYLASRSPRRRELLKQIGVSFEVLVLRENPARGGPDVDESQLADELPDDYVRRVCRAKAAVGWDRVVQRRLRRFPVLAADTVVCVDEKILGKPADPADAARMLRLLSGREHRVVTAVALKFEARIEIAVSESRVRFWTSRSPSSKPTSRAASRPTRRARTRSRAAPRLSSPSCTAAIPGSWGCRCTRPRN